VDRFRQYPSKLGKCLAEGFFVRQIDYGNRRRASFVIAFQTQHLDGLVVRKVAVVLKDMVDVLRVSRGLS
jgi:hypothetical protein